MAGLRAEMRGAGPTRYRLFKITELLYSGCLVACRCRVSLNGHEFSPERTQGGSTLEK